MAYKFNPFTGQLDIGGSGIGSTITISNINLAVDADGLEIYANDGVTLLAKIDSSGNLGIKGMVYTL